MSKPSLKKKRTILDFFSGTGKPAKRQKKGASTKKMASNSGSASCTDTGNDAVASTSGTGNKNETLGYAGATPDVGQVEVDPTQVYDDSPDLFDLSSDQPDSQEPLSGSQKIPTRKPSERKDGSDAWRGSPLKTLNTLMEYKEKFGPLQTSDRHEVMFKSNFKYDGTRPPAPYAKFKDRWDQYHVKMPCSNNNEYAGQDKLGNPQVQRRWDVIQESLLSDIPGPFELEEKILLYNSRYFGKWNFDVLHQFFTCELEEVERFKFFNETLKKMARLALQLPHLCSCPIPLLTRGRNFSLTFSQQQIACLLANAFFCTFPRRNVRGKQSEYAEYPSINFNTLYMGQPTQVKLEKLKCIVHYFTRIFKNMPCGTVAFTRQCLEPQPDWSTVNTKLTGLHVSSEGTIEDDGIGLLQVDFANQYLGGGVLGHGCVQEEIRFLICPEMIVSRLFTERLDKNECLIMRGCERFSDYDGYAGKFTWKADYVDQTERDEWGRIMCEVVAIDAMVIHDFKSQFQPTSVKRELNKALCGFNHNGRKQHLPAVCTGNWGCGAFGGDKRLKAMIQLMAAAVARRDVCYFTFDDEKLRNDLYSIHKYLTTEQRLTIGDLMVTIEQYRKNILLKHRGSGKPRMHLYEYILRVFDGSLEDTDNDSDGSVEARHDSWQDSESLEMQHWADVDDGGAGTDVAAGDEGPAVADEGTSGDKSEQKVCDSDWTIDGDIVGTGKGLKRQASNDYYKANTP